METLDKSLWRKLAVLFAFAAMVTVNYMATNGLINNSTTAAVSDSYSSLFTPASYTFFIWGLIYLLLFVYVLFQLFSKDQSRDGRLSRIAFLVRVHMSVEHRLDFRVALLADPDIGYGNDRAAV